ncbi:MAG: zinc ribbon domain-containing protein [Bacillales bacterium]|jgi:DNA-directed RNA polymerase subunit RPC12/RpoP|nr:zinc ribbon domain-containing protein [Bacillales bacterium]
MAEEDVLYSEETSGTQNEKCPSCGANLEFDPATSSLFCSHCEYRKEIKSNKKAEEEFSTLFVKETKWEEDIRAVQCPNCGAKELVSSKDIGKNCPYCGTGLVLQKEELSGKKPTHVVPFKKDKDSAVKAYLTVVRKRFFAPKLFKLGVTVNDISGVYSPSFTFDSRTVSPYKGTLGKYYYVTVGSGKDRHQERRIRYFNISGVKTHFFDDVLVQAGSKIDQKTINTLQPFYTNDAFAYKEDYLFGFSANQYSKDGPTCWNEAKKTMEVEIKRLILSGYSYDTVSSFSFSTSHFDQSYKYLLVPIFVGFVRYNNKDFNFFINGVTNKVVAKTPVSALKVLLVVGIVLVVIVVIALIAYFSGILD